METKPTTTKEIKETKDIKNIFAVFLQTLSKIKLNHSRFNDPETNVLILGYDIFSTDGKQVFKNGEHFNPEVSKLIQYLRNVQNKVDILSAINDYNDYSYAMSSTLGGQVLLTKVLYVAEQLKFEENSSSNIVLSQGIIIEHSFVTNLTYIRQKGQEIEILSADVLEPILAQIGFNEVKNALNLTIKSLMRYELRNSA